MGWDLGVFVSLSLGIDRTDGTPCGACGAGSQPAMHVDMTSALIPRDEYAALERCAYLNQASLGLIPKRSTQAMVDFLTRIAQHGNDRLTDEAEAHVLDELRVLGAGLFDAPVRAMAVVGGASEALGQLAALTAGPGGEVVLVASDFPSVTYPWLAAHARLGMAVRWV